MLNPSMPLKFLHFLCLYLLVYGGTSIGPPKDRPDLSNQVGSLGGASTATAPQMSYQANPTLSPSVAAFDVAARIALETDEGSRQEGLPEAKDWISWFRTDEDVAHFSVTDWRPPKDDWPYYLGNFQVFGEGLYLDSQYAFHRSQRFSVAIDIKCLSLCFAPFDDAHLAPESITNVISTLDRERECDVWPAERLQLTKASSVELALVSLSQGSLIIHPMKSETRVIYVEPLDSDLRDKFKVKLMSSETCIHYNAESHTRGLVCLIKGQTEGRAQQIADLIGKNGLTPEFEIPSNTYQQLLPDEVLACARIIKNAGFVESCLMTPPLPFPITCAGNTAAVAAPVEMSIPNVSFSDDGSNGDLVQEVCSTELDSRHQFPLSPGGMSFGDLPSITDLVDDTTFPDALQEDGPASFAPYSSTLSELSSDLSYFPIDSDGDGSYFANSPFGSFEEFDAKDPFTS